MPASMAESRVWRAGGRGKRIHAQAATSGAPRKGGSGVNRQAAALVPVGAVPAHRDAVQPVCPGPALLGQVGQVGQVLQFGAGFLRCIGLGPELVGEDANLVF